MSIKFLQLYMKFQTWTTLRSLPYVNVGEMILHSACGFSLVHLQTYLTSRRI